MLSIRSMSEGSGYAATHLSQNDYYSENERVVGQWFGKGAERLGLHGEVNLDDFELVRAGLDPDSKEHLRPRQSADRHDKDGALTSEGRTLYDCTFSAPKSVSVMAILGGDERLLDAHRRAVTEALTELERLSATRVRIDGKNEDRATGNLVVARYEHDCSRRLDPQLHSHCVAGNLSFDEVEQRWKALQATDIYKSRAYLSEVYRNSLARQFIELGYDIATRYSKRGKDIGFEIVGVSKETIDTFSQGSKARDAAIETFTEDKGRQPTDDEVADLVRNKRPDKLAEKSTDEVRREQRARLTPEGQARLDAVHQKALDNPREPQAEYWTQSVHAVQYAIDHTFERVSVSTDTALLTEALRRGRGRVSLEGVKTAVDVQQASGAVLRHGRDLATQMSLDREQAMIASIADGVGQYDPLGTLEPFTRRLNEAQADVIGFVMETRDFAVNIQGAAGTGKTQLLGELRHQLAKNGRNFVTVAPTNPAVAELEKVGYEDAITIKRLLDNPEQQALLKGGTLLIDEAGMIGAEVMANLIGLARHCDARIIFCGDTRQIQSVEAGDALRILQQYSPLRSTSLKEVQRQQTEAYRDAIETLRDDPNRGFHRFLAMNAIREVRYLDMPQAVAEAYLNSGDDTLLVCPTHEEIGRVTHEVRRLAKESGRLTDAQPTEHFIPLNWTQAQKREMSNFEPGQVLVFHKATKDVARNEAVELSRVEPNAVFGRGADGREVRLTAKQAKPFTVFRRDEIEVGAGDVLLLQANWRDHDLTNSERVTVHSVDAEGNKRLEDGRIMPADYKQFTHGYAVTAHASQGKTVDRVLICADEMSRELFYVAASRGRYDCQIFTTDAEALRISMTESSARTSATELAMRMNALATMQRAQAHLNEIDLQSGARHGSTPAPPAPVQAHTAAPAAQVAGPEASR